ncbi:E3 ubiquitin-protein ligase hrd1 [Penicillium cataractarum]|uniref:RING-type E3 ubiquitin transferase n=1 Tax=Penicillium cataractarum TaxID=2100454 RepID=A0A9W9R942_9EURO|nr:E3 ubiquitin-protein ligase hrd1 [Penicillium cataractarum]KAJ5355260.1 E3 ubiquitin-protein ligase hrd1 [Penicillium cataractarum]
MRLAAYAGASLALATGVFLKALHQRANFYSACVYLSQSSANLMILTNLCLLATGFILFWLQRLLYGPLRPIETEQLYERAWFAVTETCLAMTIFRGELGGWFLVMFVLLLVGKVWGWIGEGRVEYLEQQPPANPRLFHIRLALSLVLSVLFNASMLRYCVNVVIEEARADMMIMFGFEFAILTILSTSTTLRYSIALTEIYITHQQVKAKMEERRAEIRVARIEAIREHARAGASSPPTDLPDENDVNELEIDVPGWEEKGRWVFYLDLLTDFLKLVVYLVFFAILLRFFGLPIHILRDVVVTMRSFGRRIMDFLRYRNATRDMNDRYPDATAEEVAREDVCIICREEMTSTQPPVVAEGEAAPQPAAAAPRVPDRLRPKKLPCGHILHFACLRSWLERQQNCPTCRRPVVAPQRLQGAAADANNLPGNVGGAAQPNGVGGNQMPGQPGAQGELPRARVYQFGPFRIGFGAVRGDLFHNLHQQIHQGNAPLQPPANANPPGARQIGFGLGFGRRPQAPTTVQHAPNTGGSSSADIHAQLQQIEQQIAQEISSLRAAAEQLRRVTQLQMELDRLRLHANPQAQTLTSPTPTTTLPTGTSTITSRRQFVSNPGATPLAAGDSRLPEGLTLPPGWTLLPLHSTELGSGNLAQDSNPTPTTSVPLQSTSLNALESQDIEAPASETVPAATAADRYNEETEISAPSTGTADTGNAIPNWSVPSASSSAEHRADSPSQEWTDVQSEQVPEAGPSVIPPAWGSTGQTSKADTDIDSSYAESTSKGKSRAATVEEAADEETP